MQVLLINIFIGTRRGSGIDNLAHFGGLAAGALAGFLLAPARGSSGRSDGSDALLPPLVTRGLLAGLAVGYVLALREAARLVPAMRYVLQSRGR